MKRSLMKRTAWNRTAATRTEADAKRRMERRVKAMRAKGPSAAARKWAREAKEKADGMCERCGQEGHHAHHRATRSRRPDLVLDPSNAVWLCGSCHTHVHLNPKESTAAGWLSDEAYENRKAA